MWGRHAVMFCQWHWRWRFLDKKEIEKERRMMVWFAEASSVVLPYINSAVGNLAATFVPFSDLLLYVPTQVAMSRHMRRHQAAICVFCLATRRRSKVVNDKLRYICICCHQWWNIWTPIRPTSGLLQPNDPEWAPPTINPSSPQSTYFTMGSLGSSVVEQK